MTIYLLSYNNYYNRLVKKEDSLSDYLPYVLAMSAQYNFNPNDGVDTKIVVNYDESTAPDYALVVNGTEIVSRWFVTEARRTRGGQYEVELRRDVVADYYNIIVNAPCFVQKGYVDASNPLIFNNENMSFNQIKMKEYLLDGGQLKTPWVVAYLPRYNGEGQFQSWSGSFADQPPTSDYVVDSLSNYKYYKYQDEAYIYTDDIQFRMYYHKRADYDKDGTTAIDRVWGLSKTGYYNAGLNYNAISNELPIYEGTQPTYATEEDRVAAYNKLINKLNSYNTVDGTTGLPTNTYSKVGTYDGYLTLVEEANKVIQVGSGTSAKFYRIVTEISTVTYDLDNETALPNTAGSFGEFVFNTLTTGTGTWTYLSGNTLKVPRVRWPYQNPGVKLKFQEISNQDALNYSFNYTHIVTKNTPYEIIAAPYYDVTLTHGTDILAHNGETAVNWFMDMAKAGTVYDIQLVPFVGIDSGDISKYEIAQCYYSLADKRVQAWAVKLPWSQFSKQYQLNIPIDNNVKQSIQCDLYRLTSPNGVGNFDFNPAKNGGLVGYEVDCTLMPFNPYIKINPTFNTYSEDSQTNMYGGDFNDYRGLICGGDFSLPMVTSAWENYQVNNKYYQQVFDRQIASLEKQNNWQLAEGIVGAGAGVVGGAAAGAIAGSVVPGIGTVVGAVVGGVASAVGGAVDVIKGQALHNEQIDLMRDQFGYQLQTIQAKPDTLTRTTAYNINNKYFPYIEYFSCTETEKEIFRDKIKYNGMTVMAIGKIKDYLNPVDETYVKGKIIRLTGLEDDYHVGQVIVNEILQGVYIQ